MTNDSEGRFFSDRFLIEVHPHHGDYLHEYFATKDKAFAYLSEVVGLSILSDKDVEELQKLWHEQDRESYCFLYEFEVTD